jgi:hypothetical protein
MSIPLTIGSFLLGYRTAAAQNITSNPFYNAWADRGSAESYVWRCGYPILRDSSRRGLFAITFICRVRGTMIHSLLRQNSDLSVECLNDEGEITQYFTDIYELLDGVIWPRQSPAQGPRRQTPLAEIAPALIPLMPRVIQHMVEEDPC